MVIRWSSYLLLIAMLFASARTVGADQFSFVFEYPEWDSIFSNDPLVGTNPTVFLTVDNGGTSRVDQVWDLFSDTVSVTVTTDGGFSNTWVNSDITISDGFDFDFISTDSSGLGTLDLGPVRDSRVVFSNSTGTWQFGARTGLSGATQSWLAEGPNFDDSLAFHGSDIGFSVVETVPEPSSAFLLVVASAGLLRRRR